MNALDDVDVLEFTQYVAGPNCTQWLATLGATVLKFEPPGGESAREAQFQQFSSFNLGGKRSVSADLKTDEGLEIAQDLAERADVIVENYAPGVLSKFDLDYESVSDGNDDVIYCSISGFGEGGPYSGYPGNDPMMQPISGLMAYVGNPDCPNLYEGEAYPFGTNMMIDFCTGSHAALLISSALRRRDRTGEGEFLDVALFDTAISFMSTWIGRYTAGEDVPRRSGDRIDDVGPVGIFEAGDGKPIYIYGFREGAFEPFCRVIGRTDLASDERFETADKRDEHIDELREELEEAFQDHDRDELFDLIVELGVIAAPFQDVGDIVDEDPHVEARGMLADTIDPRTGEEIKAAMIPFRSSSGRPSFDRPPRVGEDTRTVLGEMGFSDERIEDLAEAGVLTTADSGW